MPRSAPLLSEVRVADRQSRIVLTPVTQDVAAASEEPATASFPKSFVEARAVNYENFVAGDGVDVIIWERDGLDVFPANATNGASDLGAFTIGRDGDIQLPYVGKVHIEGLNPSQARMALLNGLKHIVIATDVRLTLMQQHGSLVTVQGDVTRAGVYPLGQGMLTLSAALSLTAPDQSDPDQTLVAVRREGVSGVVRLSDIYRDPTQDIALRPGDSIVISLAQQYVTVLGAAGVQGRVKITKRNYSVLDAVADSRGAADSTADLSALFLVHSGRATGDGRADTRPQVYHFDMRHPQDMVLAKEFAVRDGDALFISDAPFTQVQKVLSSLSASLGTARSVSALSQ